MLDRNSLAEVLGLLAVVASLAFVALEIRQANQIAIGTTSYELGRNWMSINDLMITNADVGALVIALSDENFVPKDDLQSVQAHAFARRFLNMWVSAEEAYKTGIASEALYSAASMDVKAVVGNIPGVVRVFETVGEDYDLTKYRLLDPLVEAIERLPARNDAAR